MNEVIIVIVAVGSAIYGTSVLVALAAMIHSESLKAYVSYNQLMMDIRQLNVHSGIVTVAATLYYLIGIIAMVVTVALLPVVNTAVAMTFLREEK